MLTGTLDGAGVEVAVGVIVALGVPVTAGVGVTVAVPVTVGVAVTVTVPVTVGVAVTVTVPVTVGVAVTVTVLVTVGVAVTVTVLVAVGVVVTVTVLVPVGVVVTVAVTVGVVVTVTVLVTVGVVVTVTVLVTVGVAVVVTVAVLVGVTSPAGRAERTPRAGWARTREGPKRSATRLRPARRPKGLDPVLDPDRRNTNRPALRDSIGAPLIVPSVPRSATCSRSIARSYTRDRPFRKRLHRERSLNFEPRVIEGSFRAGAGNCPAAARSPPQIRERARSEESLRSCRPAAARRA
jgi:hypothetical protein